MACFSKRTQSGCVTVLSIGNEYKTGPDPKFHSVVDTGFLWFPMLFFVLFFRILELFILTNVQRNLYD